MDKTVTRSESLKAWVADDGDNTLAIDYQLTDDSVVFDVGGFYGHWTKALLEKISPVKPRVFVFEPVERFYDALAYLFRDEKKVLVIGEALSDKGGVAMISDDEEGSSMHLAMADTSINTVEVGDFLLTYDLTKVDLISINIEGHEFPLLKRMLEVGAEKFENLQVQFHAFYPDAGRLREELRKELAKTHVETYCYPFVWESWRKKS